MQAVAHQVGGRGGLVHVDLEERGGGHVKVPAVHRLGVPLLSGWDLDIGMDQVRLDEVVPRIFAGADGKLCGLAAAVLQAFQERVHAVVHQEALFDAQELAGLAVYEAQRAFPVDGEPRVVPVTVLVRRGDHLGYRGVFQTANPAEGVGHLLALGLQLSVVRQVLPLAAGAHAVVGTRRLHPVGRCLKHLHYLGGDVFPVDLHHLGHHPLPRDATRHEHITSVKFGHRFAQPSPRR